MLRSPAGKLMRSTLVLAQALREHHAMRQLRSGRAVDSELDLTPWLARMEQLEALDEAMHEIQARTFLVRMLDHDGKRALMSRDYEAELKKKKEAAVKKKKQRKKKKTARAAKRSRASREQEEEEEEAAQDEEAEDGEPLNEYTDDEIARVVNEQRAQLVTIKGRQYVLRSLLEDPANFLDHVHPLLFVCTRPPERRPNPAHETHITIVLHCGMATAEVQKRIKWCIGAVGRVREGVRSRFGLDSAEQVCTRVVLVLWGTPFHPSTGKSTKLFRTRVRALNEQFAAINLSFASFAVDELLYDATEHDDVAAVEIVTDRSAHPRLRYTKDFELPYIRVTDPQARIRDLRVGQIIKVHRRDFALGGESCDYRVVVDANT